MHLVQFFVPSTGKGNTPVSAEEFASRVVGARMLMVDVFGAANASALIWGDWRNDQGTTITERVKIVWVYAEDDGFEEKLDKVKDVARKWAKLWEQESVLVADLKLGGNLHFIGG